MTMTMTQARAAIRIDDLTKRFRSQTAVDGLSLEVPEGSVFGLLGENGAGKTTTIQTLLGLLAPDGGRVEVLGLDPSRDGLEVRRRVGYVPEVPALYDWMTVAEIGWFAAGFHPDASGSTAPYQARYAEQIAGLRPAAEAQDQGALQGDAVEGLAGPGPGVGPGAPDPRRADVGARRARAQGVPGEHGRPRRRGEDRPALEPPDRRGRARGEPRGAPAPGAS